MSVSTIGYGSYQATSIIANFRQRARSSQELADDFASASSADSRGAPSPVQPGPQVGGSNRTMTGPGGVDFATLIGALDAGDVAGAKKALATILQNHIGDAASGAPRDAAAANAASTPDDAGSFPGVPAMAGSTFRIRA